MISYLYHHYKLSLERIQKLYRASPEVVVYFLGGSLPFTALLHMRQLSLLLMIAHLGPANILHQLAVSVLASATSPPQSWFTQIRAICSQYSIEDPLNIRSAPPKKSTFKTRTKSLILDFWEKKLRFDSSQLPSLQFFHPKYYSLSKPHPVWLTAGENPYEVEKACIQARMLSGRYRNC